MTASGEHGDERRQDQRRRVAQPAYFGENRTAARRTDDAETDAQQPAESSPPVVTPQQGFEFLSGLIQMERSG